MENLARYIIRAIHRKTERPRKPSTLWTGPERSGM
jgi:hypothetical protein